MQYLPPFAGGGESQVRVDICTPPPQLRLHSLNLERPEAFDEVCSFVVQIMGYLRTPLTPGAVLRLQCLPVYVHTFALLAPLIVAATSAVSPWHVLRSTAKQFVAVVAPKSLANGHVGANARAVSENQLALLMVGEFFAGQFRLRGGRFDEVRFRFVQHAAAVVLSAEWKKGNWRENVSLRNFLGFLEEF